MVHRALLGADHNPEVHIPLRVLLLKLQQPSILGAAAGIDLLQLGQIGKPFHILLAQGRQCQCCGVAAILDTADFHPVIDPAIGSSLLQSNQGFVVPAILSMNHLQLGEIIQLGYILLAQLRDGDFLCKALVQLPLEGDIPQNRTSGELFLQFIIGRTGHFPLPQIQRRFISFVEVPLYDHEMVKCKKQSCRDSQDQNDCNTCRDPLCPGTFHTLFSLVLFRQKWHTAPLLSRCIMRKIHAYVKAFFAFAHPLEW